MADNTRIGPIFRGANGGLSDDLFTGRKLSFYSSKDIEIREDAKSIYPKQVPAYADASTKIDVGDGSAGERNVINVTYSENDYGWLVCSSRSVYVVADADNSVTKLCTFSEDICDLEIFNGYIYISTNTHLYYKSDNGSNRANMAASSDASSIYYGVMPQTLNNISRHPLYASDVCMAVGDKNIIYKVTKEIPNMLLEGFKIQDGFSIAFMNELGGYIRVVANDVPYGSEVLLWDKYSKIATEVIPLEGFHIIGSAIYGGYHYLLSDKGLGLLNGYQYYILKKAQNDVLNLPKNPMCVYDDKLIFIANNSLYIYGAKNKNYADVLNVWHKEDVGLIGAIGCSGTGTNQGIVIARSGYYSSPNYYPITIGKNYGLATTGELQTMCYYGTSMSEIKQSMYLRVGYHLGKEGDNSGDIHVYYRTEADATDDNPENWQWHPVQQYDEGLKASWDMRSPFATTLKLNCRFQWIQFKFVITNCIYDDNGTTKTKDTNLYSADLYYNIMLD